jgi:hypothetical protein
VSDLSNHPYVQVHHPEAVALARIHGMDISSRELAALLAAHNIPAPGSDPYVQRLQHDLGRSV